MKQEVFGGEEEVEDVGGWRRWSDVLWLAWMGGYIISKVDSDCKHDETDEAEDGIDACDREYEDETELDTD